MDKNILSLRIKRIDDKGGYLTTLKRTLEVRKLLVP